MTFAGGPVAAGAGISLTVGDGESLAVPGPSGSVMGASLRVVAGVDADPDAASPVVGVDPPADSDEAAGSGPPGGTIDPPGWR